MNNLNNFLILGHRGFLGNQLVSHFQSRGLEFRTLDSRLTLSNNEEVLGDLIDKNTIVINCIAKGVTQISDSYIDVLETNANLLKSILNCFIRTNGQKFFHFASNYELEGRFFIPDSRRSYVDSKKIGSEICNEFIRNDKRINLIYLPTLIAATQPRGRFVADFINAQRNSKELEINFPNSDLEILTLNHFLRYFEDRYTFRGEQIGFAPVDIRIKVFQLANLMNQILGDLGATGVSIKYPDTYKAMGPISRVEVSDSLFLDTVKTYLITMMGGKHE